MDEDERAAGVQRQFHRVGDLVAVELTRRAPEDREVLAGEMNQAAVDRRRAGDHTIRGNLLAGQSEEGLPVLCEQAHLLEAAGIDQGINALARRLLSFLPL